MLAKLIRALWSIRNFERIPKLPRGMLAERYEEYTRQDGRVLHRLGARSPAGVKVALKRAGVGTVPELIELLDHYKPSHRFRDRLSRMAGRFFNAEDHHPHRSEILRAVRPRGRTPAQLAEKERIREAIRKIRD
jgi:hypothetical protein